ncbi:hypothetical protein TNCV_17321 [Trichonephila clavipes]|nr:hypothetical protein TNCV_17321 [Trichonephila clavipes]
MSTMGNFTYAGRTDTRITYTAVQMVTAELLYKCITHSFLIDECLITELFSGDIVNHVTRHDAGLRRPARSPSLKESILNVVAYRLESRTRAIGHLVSVSRQIICKCTSPTASVWYINER